MNNAPINIWAEGGFVCMCTNALVLDSYMEVKFLGQSGQGNVKLFKSDQTTLHFP